MRTSEEFAAACFLRGRFRTNSLTIDGVRYSASELLARLALLSDDEVRAINDAFLTVVENEIGVQG